MNLLILPLLISVTLSMGKYATLLVAECTQSCVFPCIKAREHFFVEDSDGDLFKSVLCKYNPNPAKSFAGPIN